MGRTDRVSREDQPPSPRKWLTMDSAPKDGSRVELLIPYDPSIFTEEACTDQGFWDATAPDYDWCSPEDKPPIRGYGCWRFDGDDGPFDIEPVAWRPILFVNEQSASEMEE